MEYNGEEIVAVYCDQGRHYMAVVNLNRVYFCRLYGRGEDRCSASIGIWPIEPEEKCWRIISGTTVLARIPLQADGQILESLRQAWDPLTRARSPAASLQRVALRLQEDSAALSSPPEIPGLSFPYARHSIDSTAAAFWRSKNSPVGTGEFLVHQIDAFRRT